MQQAMEDVTHTPFATLMDSLVFGPFARESFAPLLLLPGERLAVVEEDEFDVERLAVFAIQK
jgi:hypothetical protein